VGEKARQYKPSTIRRLDILSGNQCAEPNCKKKLIARDEETIISKICHIEAANENGPRYNQSQTDEERRHFDNLILLCDECHSIIDNNDNEVKYPVALLKEWKRNHESLRHGQLANSSILSIAIDAIAKVDFEEVSDKNIGMPPNIDSKIKFNDIKRNKSLIKEYAVYQAKLNPLYNELENQGSFKKEKLLRNIRQLYLKVKGRYASGSDNELDVVRANADNIIEDIEEELITKITDNNTYEEDISFGISIIIVDAFMRCKILEEPA